MQQRWIEKAQPSTFLNVRPLTEGIITHISITITPVAPKVSQTMDHQKANKQQPSTYLDDNGK